MHNYFCHTWIIAGTTLSFCNQKKEVLQTKMYKLIRGIRHFYEFHSTQFNINTIFQFFSINTFICWIIMTFLVIIVVVDIYKSDTLLLTGQYSAYSSHVQPRLVQHSAVIEFGPGFIWPRRERKNWNAVFFVPQMFISRKKKISLTIG